MIVCVKALSEQVHEAESALLRNVQKDKLSACFERLEALAVYGDQVLHVARASVEIDNIVFVIGEINVLDQAELDDVNSALDRDVAHVFRGFYAFDVRTVDIALEKSASASYGKELLT